MKQIAEATKAAPAENEMLLYIGVSDLGNGRQAKEVAYVAQVTTAEHVRVWTNYSPGPEPVMRPDTANTNAQAARYAGIKAALGSGTIPRGTTLWIVELEKGAELMWVFGELRPGRHRNPKGKPYRNSEAIRAIEALAAELGVTVMAKVATINHEFEDIAAVKGAARAAMEDCREWRERGLE